ncbi:phage holin family protein [Parvimonas micra]|uniref:phage holin family protein n=1 Tax=Parvimonas micra TaxID=33033 RepID=UPI00040EB37D|nr:phage holin family protein [Parvimonas micra]
MMIEFLRNLLQTEDTKILFILALIAISMILDFATGTIAAKINNNIKFESQKGINGILRKICSMIVMIFFIPLSVLVPDGIGTTLVYVLYLGYLVMEVTSVLENLKKMGIDTSLFTNFLKNIEKRKNKE